MADEAKKASGGGLDLASIAGIVVALGAILGGLVLEGGEIKDVAQVTAAMIVLGGTLGAVMVSTPPKTLKGAMKRMMGVIKDPVPPIGGLLEEVIEYATQARKMGLVSLEDASQQVDDPFLRKGLTLAVDGSDLQEIRSMLELEIDLEEGKAEAEAKVFEGAGGLRAHHRDHRRRDGPDPGDEEPGRHRRGGPRHRGGVCRDSLRRRRLEPAVPAYGAEDQGAGPCRDQTAHADCGRYRRNCRRAEPQAAALETGGVHRE